LQDDPQDRGALRQGNIALIHSAPTGDAESRHFGAMRSIELRCAIAHPRIARFPGAQLRT
jgi:hypothetical protein